MLGRSRAVFADPIHGTINFENDREITEPLLKVLDSRAFQRLRRISQLGLASHVFPGATHTRFLHGLGAAHLAVAVTSHLIRTSDNKVASELKEYKVAIALAALLHDLGHGPFSHAFERVRCTPDGGPAVSHEQWTTTLVLQQLGDALHGCPANPSVVAALLSKKDGSIPSYIRQIISSQLDVDRLDYLPRDAHFAGVSLGRIDIGYLIDSLEVVSTGRVRSLGLTAKGVRPYEAFSLARHHMNRSVYYHPKVRVFEFMLAAILKHAVGSIEERTIPEYLVRLHEWNDKALAVQEFATKFHKLYADVTESEIWTMIGYAARRANGLVRRLADDLLTRSPLPFYFIRRGLASQVKEELHLAGLGNDIEILSAESIAYKKSSAPVLIQGRDELLKPAQEISSIISFHMDRPDGDDILMVVERDRATEVEQLVRPLLDLPNRAGPVGTLRSSRPPEIADALRTVTLDGATVNDGRAVQAPAEPSLDDDASAPPTPQDKRRTP